MEDGVVLVPLTISGLEPEARALGMDWRRKREFHVTAVSAKRVARLLGVEVPDVWQAIESEAASHEITSVTLFFDQLRLVREDENRTLVVMAKADGLAELYESLSSRFGHEIPPPPAHVTLYTNPGGEGIGLHDGDDLRELSRPLSEAEADEVRSAVGL